MEQYRLPGMTPEIADSARDVLALIRAALNDDPEATVAIAGSLNPDETRNRLYNMASLTAILMRSAYGDKADEYMTWFTQKFLMAD